MWYYFQHLIQPAINCATAVVEARLDLFYRAGHGALIRLSIAVRPAFPMTLFSLRKKYKKRQKSGRAGLLLVFRRTIPDCHSDAHRRRARLIINRFDDGPILYVYATSAHTRAVETSRRRRRIDLCTLYIFSGSLWRALELGADTQHIRKLGRKKEKKRRKKKQTANGWISRRLLPHRSSQMDETDVFQDLAALPRRPYCCSPSLMLG